MKTCYHECCKPKMNCTVQSLGYPQLGTHWVPTVLWHTVKTQMVSTQI